MTQTDTPVSPNEMATATKRLEFVGYSDDTFACTGPGIDVDRDTCASREPVTMRVQSGDRSLLVVGQYAPGECAGWLIGVANDDWPADPPTGERYDQPIPPWPIRYAQTAEDRYTPRLVIEAPADATVTLLGVEDDDDA